MREAWRPRWPHTLLALAIGALLRLWFIRHDPVIDGDTLLYGDIAKNLLQHHTYGFTQEGAAPAATLIRLPGYPLFLALCFAVFGVEHYGAVLVVQAVIDLAACWLLALLAGRLFRSRAAATTALWLAALCPFTANYVATPLTETLTLASMTAAFYGLLRWCEQKDGWNGWLAALAGALAVSLLLRPEQGLLVAAVLLTMTGVLWRRAGSLRGFRILLPVVVCALGVLLPFVPWTVRNAITFHVFEPLAPRSAVDPGEMVPRGFDRWFRTWGIEFASTEDIYWNYDGAPLAMGDVPRRAFDTPGEYATTAQLLADYNRTTKPTREIEARFSALAEERIRSRPVRYYVVLPVARLMDMLLRPRTELLAVPLDWWRYREHPRQTVLAAGLVLLNAFYLVAGVLGTVCWWRVVRAKPQRALFFAMTASVLLRCLLLLTLDNAEPRYTLELFPVLIVAASALMLQKRASGDRLLSFYRS